MMYRKEYHFFYDKQPIKVKVHLEKRSNARVSIGKNAVIIRMPVLTPKKEQERLLKQFEQWAMEQFDAMPKLKQRFFGKVYQDGDTIEIYDRTYSIHIQKADRKTHFAQIKGKDIFIEISKEDTSPFIQKSIKTLLSRVIAQDCMPSLEARVDELNDRYFKESINGIRLKQNQSNWGSCSSNRNLNFSTRLLFAPKDVIDYVIIHELAHLKELNHSSRFWKLVQNAMPNYAEKEKWLQQHGAECSF